ncbi:MAG: flagellar hook-length control protein FliK [Burkholderiales bacterium]
MLPADITSIRPPVQVEAATPASATTNIAQEALSNLTQNAIGKLFQAQILAQLDDGTFLTNVADNVLRMALPAGVAVGDTLEMTLLATDPRPAFLLEQQSSDTSASFSSAAKLINAVLQTAQQTDAPTALAGKTPLLASPAASAPELAAALQDSIEFSGVFYESHVSQWVNGERPLSDLLREPQMQAQEKSLVQTLDTLSSARLKVLANDDESSRDADVVVRSSALTPKNAQTINLQLNSLEQHRVAWQGELWPGQRMEWEISEEENGRNQSGELDADQVSWKSTVHFDLPNLGKVSASIHLSGGHVSMQVSTLSARSAAALKAHGDELVNALDAAGSTLDSLIIKQDGQP